MATIFRKRIPQWSNHDVWFYTNNIVRQQESEARYRKMDKVPEKIQDEFDNGATAVFQDRKTGEIVKVYMA